MRSSGLGFVLVFGSWLASCGGSGADPAAPAPPAPPPVPARASASFTAPATCTALTPLAFDASASTSSDGSALVYRWSFGDGALGNGAKIAHAFAAAGSYSVTLTVIDGANRTATALSLTLTPAVLESSGADTWLAVPGKRDGASNTPVELRIFKLVR